MSWYRVRQILRLTALLAIIVSAIVWLDYAYSHAETSRRTSIPPECVTASITNWSGTGRTVYIKWCGTGAGGESPLQSGVHTMIVDGNRLSPFTCPKSNPCIVLWPASPQS